MKYTNKIFAFLILFATPLLSDAQGIADLSSWPGNAHFSGETLSRLGHATAAGDFNGDGRWDVAIAAPGARANSGDIYLFFGSDDLLANTAFDNPAQSANVVVQGEAEMQLGIALYMGDCNGDGLEDLIIGAPRYNNARGEVWIVYGNTTQTGTVNAPNVRLTGVSNGDKCGSAVSTSFVNDDTIQDLIIGSPGADPYNRDSAGRVDVILGSGSLPATIALSDDASTFSTINGSDTGARTGSALSTAFSFSGTLFGNDLNDDGNGDVIIGAPGQIFAGRVEAGAVHIFLSATDLANVVDLSTPNSFAHYRQLGGARFLDSIGRSLACSRSGPINYLLIGAPNGDHNYVRSGLIYEATWAALNPLTNRVDLGNQAHYNLKAYTSTEGDSLGSHVSAIGSQWVLGASGVNAQGRDNSGVCYVITEHPEVIGNVNINDLNEKTVSIVGPASDELLGNVITLGDFDNDAKFDLVLGIPRSNSFAGGVHIIRGGLPYAFNFRPLPGQSGVPVGTAISFSARDDSEGIEQDETSISINGIDYTAGSPEVTIESEDDVFQFTVQPANAFPIDIPVPVVIQLEDQNGNESPRYDYQFVTGLDDRAPTIEQFSPNPGEVNVATTHDIEFVLLDSGQGVDQTSIEITLFYDDFNETYSWDHPDMTITGTLSATRVLFDPPEIYPANQEISVTVRAADLLTPSPNVMTPYTYSFFTMEDIESPLITEILPAPGRTIDVTSNIVVFLEDNSAGVNTAETRMFLRSEGQEEEQVPLTFGETSSGTQAIYENPGTLFPVGTLNVRLATEDMSLPPNVMEPDSTWSYTVVEDLVPPTITATPEPFSADAAQNVLVILTLDDNAAGVDSTSISVNIDGIQLSHASFRWTKLEHSGYTLTYQNPASRPYGETVTVHVEASDKANTPNDLDTTYTFTTQIDQDAPELLLIDPTPGFYPMSVRDSLIWEAGDALSGLDPESAVLALNDENMSEALEIRTDVTQPGAEYRFVYRQDTPFPYEGSLEVFFSVSDLSTSPNPVSARYKVYTEPDEDAPYMTNLRPAREEENVARNSDIVFHLKDAGVGVELDSLHLFIEEIEAERADLTTTVIDSGYEVRYNPEGFFPYNNTVHVRTVVHDKADIPNRMDEEYWFVTLADDREPPYIANMIPDDNETDWPVNASIEFSLLDDGTGVNTNETRIRRTEVDPWNISQSFEPVEDGYRYTIAQENGFRYSDTVSVTVTGRDLASPANVSIPMTYTFYTVQDEDAPILSDLFPEQDAEITRGRPLEFVIFDPLAGVDTSTVTLRINNEDVSEHLKILEIPSGGWQAFFKPEEDWTIGANVSAFVSVSDSSRHTNTTETSWSFSIVPDVVSPFVPLDSLSIAPNARNIAMNDTLKVVVIDEGVGLDQNRLELSIGPDVLAGTQADSVYLGYRFRIPLKNLTLFPGQQVEYRTTAWDKAATPNKMAEFSGTFTLAPPNNDFSVVPTTMTPNGDGIWDKAIIHHPGNSSTEVTVFDLRGRKVATLSGAPAEWNGTDENGDPVPGGLYIIQLKAKGKVRQATVAVAR